MEQAGVDWSGWVKAFLLPIIGFVAIFSVARADIGNLKERVSKLETMPEVVSAMQADLKNVKDSQSEMRQDIKTLLQRVH